MGNRSDSCPFAIRDIFIIDSHLPLSVSKVTHSVTEISEVSEISLCWGQASSTCHQVHDMNGSEVFSGERQWSAGKWLNIEVTKHKEGFFRN